MAGERGGNAASEWRKEGDSGSWERDGTRTGDRYWRGDGGDGDRERCGVERRTEATEVAGSPLCCTACIVIVSTATVLSSSCSTTVSVHCSPCVVARCPWLLAESRSERRSRESAGADGHDKRRQIHRARASYGCYLMRGTNQQMMCTLTDAGRRSVALFSLCCTRQALKSVSHPLLPLSWLPTTRATLRICGRHM